MNIPLRQLTPAQARLPMYAIALLQDLIDALWLEQLYDYPRHCSFSITAGGNEMLIVHLDDARSLHLYGYRMAGLRPFRLCPDAPALQTAHDGLDIRPLGAEEVVEQLQTAAWWQEQSGRFLHFFRLSIQQAQAITTHEAAIAKALQQAPDELLPWEVLSCLKDRPFHPLARAKDWEGDTDVAAFLPQTMTAFALTWIAVERTRLRAATGTDDQGQPLAEALLQSEQLERLRLAAHQHDVGGPAWLWLPVHPWQWRWLQARRPALIKDCVLLGNDFGQAAATASLRSLALPQRPQVHLKLSLSVNTLGAIRTLPPRYLHNAIAAAACLDTLRTRDNWLAQHLLLCDETHWWSKKTAAADDQEMIGNQGELGCLIRRYPALPQRRLIPMAALPVQLADGSLPVFDHLLGAGASAESAWQLFDSIARLLIGIGLRCCSNGVMPELHGQNLLLVCHDSKVEALLLRDHDTLRICAKTMREHQLAVPQYCLDRSTPNTLELDDLSTLLAYFQTLALGVNLYATLAALAQRYEQPEAHGWRIIGAAIAATLEKLPLHQNDRHLLCTQLLEQAQWPFKKVLAPLLARKEFSTGMPSDMGTIANPLLIGEP